MCIFIYIDPTLVELNPDPVLIEFELWRTSITPPEIHEAFFLKVFTKTQRS